MKKKKRTEKNTAKSTKKMDVETKDIKQEKTLS